MNFISNTPVQSEVAKGRPRNDRQKRLRVLIVSPELGVSNFLSQTCEQAPCVKAGGLADVCALLVDSLAESGLDVHVAMPHFQSLHQPGAAGDSPSLHLCQDKEFSCKRSVYEGCQYSNLRASLAFQRFVIQHVVPDIQPDLIHCHDWMTGLVPAAARNMGIPSLFTLHNLHDERTSLGYIEEQGLDAKKFWEHLYYHQFPGSYESTRDYTSISMLASGILAADEMNTVSQSFLDELVSGVHATSWAVVDAARGKLEAGRAHGITNSLSTSLRPGCDAYLARQYDAEHHVAGKRVNKHALQRTLGLEENEEAPLLFWPSRLDPVQKGCHLLADILDQLMSNYSAIGMQVVFVGDGPYRKQFEDIASIHGLQSRIAVRGFSEGLSRLGYAGSDFTLMPSSYEPCGLSQMIALRYGSLPIVHATGGLRDTVQPLKCEEHCGNGFAFEVHDAAGLRWAIDEAMRYFMRSAEEKRNTVARIMVDASAAFSPDFMIDQYLGIYRDLLKLKKQSNEGAFIDG